MDEVTIQIESNHPELAGAVERLRTLAEQVCRRFGQGAICLELAIVDDPEIRRLERQFFDQDETTDVISFDLSEAGEPQRTLCIAVNVDEAQRQARRRSHGVETELALYVVHGLLHQFGFDDVDPMAAERMHQMEDRILEDEGFGVVYERPVRTIDGPPQSKG
jgi:probable rRNA maturation factor